MTASDLAYLSLIRRPVSTTVSILSLAFALGISGWLLNMQTALFASVEVREPGIRYVIGPKSNGLSLLLDSIHLAGMNADVIDYYLMKTLRETIGPDVIIPMAHFANFRGAPVIGTEDSFFQRPSEWNPPKIAEGRWYNLGVPEAVIGSEAARRMGLKVGDRFVADSVLSGTAGESLWTRPLQVVGILAPSGLPRDRGIYTDIRHAWRYHVEAIRAGKLRMVRNGRGVTAFLVGFKPGREDAARELYEKVHNASNAQVIDVEREIAGLRSLLGQGRKALAGISFLLLLLAVSIASLLFSERFETVKKDLGILRALGYSRVFVAGAIVWEAVFVSLLGISGGMVIERIGYLVTPLLWNPPWLLHPTWPNSGLVVLWSVTLFASIPAVVIPLIRLYGWDAHDALKGM